jgi:hypothetical protein
MSETAQTPVGTSQVATQLFNRMVNKIADIKKSKGWKNEVHNRLVYDYTRSLINGNGSVPKDLCRNSARQVYTAFMEAVGELAIEPNTFPGQRVDAPSEELAAAS